ncbi:MAG: GspH/FimT family pseudopilin [Stagnimonas sp.]|nr:GspH/FimT family pseudopilin [Stagnimonas sp.]
MNPPNRGFSLLELLVVLAISGILLAVGLPGLREMLVNGSRREAATGLYAALNRARSEAIARNGTVAVCARDLAATTPSCAGSANWMNGWLVYALASDGSQTTISVQAPVASTLRFQAAPAGVVSFDASGRTTVAADFRLCPGADAGDQRSRLVRVRRSGGITLNEAATCG